MGFCEVFLLVLVTIIFPPAGVAIVAGCGADLLINILLTCLGYFPGHIHAFYLEYTYYKRRNDSSYSALGPAPGVYSDRVNNPGYMYGRT